MSEEKKCFVGKVGVLNKKKRLGLVFDEDGRMFFFDPHGIDKDIKEETQVIFQIKKSELSDFEKIERFTAFNIKPSMGK